MKAKHAEKRPKIKAYFATLEAFSNCFTNFLLVKSNSAVTFCPRSSSVNLIASKVLLETTNAVVLSASFCPISDANLSIPIAKPIAGVSSPPKLRTRLSYLPPPQTAF